jgi:hypothetical protein
MEEKHRAKKTNKCCICGKMFLIERRLKKHVNETWKCMFFLSNEIGCKFAHGDHEHDEIENIEDNDNDQEKVDIEGRDDEYIVSENQCHLCRLQLASKDDLISHEDYFQGVGICHSKQN